MGFDRTVFPEVPLACQFRATLERCLPFAVEGRVHSKEKHRIVRIGIGETTASICELQNANQTAIELEVDSTPEGTAVLRCANADDIQTGARIRLKRTVPTFPVGEYVLGRVLDAHGQSLSGANVTSLRPRVPIERNVNARGERPPVESLLQTGIPLIDEFPSVGMGQRVLVVSPGLKLHAWLLERLLSYPTVDNKVLSQTNSFEQERSNFLHEGSLRKHRPDWTAIVASPTSSFSEKRQVLLSATAVSEYFRDSGKDVLLVFDMIGFASPNHSTAAQCTEMPNWHSLVKQLCGRVGRSRRGSITGFFLMDKESAQKCVDQGLDDSFDCHIWLEFSAGNEEHSFTIDRIRSKNRLPLKLAKKLIADEGFSKHSLNRS